MKRTSFQERHDRVLAGFDAMVAVATKRVQAAEGAYLEAILAKQRAPFGHARQLAEEGARVLRVLDRLGLPHSRFPVLRS